MLFGEAVQYLRSIGKAVEPSDIPGLTMVDGHELTIEQVVDYALQCGGPR